MQSFNTFLSHKYDAPEVNEFFFRLFSKLAVPSLEIDDKGTDLSVTRLERRIRDVDAFIGVYPFDPPETSNPPRADQLAKSRYFRLELDIASRARKPGLIFTDTRFRNVFNPPSFITQEPFNISEILASGDKPNQSVFEQAVAAFCARVNASQQFKVADRLFEPTPDCVGILIPSNGSYGAEHLAAIRAELDQNGFNSEVLEWPLLLTPGVLARINAFDWMVLDVGPESQATGVVGFLHGMAKPAIRLLKVTDATMPNPPCALYDGVEVGYKKDIVRWSDLDTLRTEFAKRTGALSWPSKRISTLAQAMDHFLEPTRIQKPVFISYSGADQDVTAGLRTALAARFAKTFDYRDDNKSIPGGSSWAATIFEQINKSAVGIVLLSPTYLASGNCLHEMEQLFALRDQGKLQLFPFKVVDQKFDIPAVAQSLQYDRLWQKPAKEWVDSIVQRLNKDALPPDGSEKVSSAGSAQ